MAEAKIVSGSSIVALRSSTFLFHVCKFCLYEYVNGKTIISLSEILFSYAEAGAGIHGKKKFSSEPVIKDVSLHMHRDKR